MNKFVVYNQEHLLQIQLAVKNLSQDWITEVTSHLVLPTYLRTIFLWSGNIGKGLRGTLVLLANQSFGSKNKEIALQVAGIIELLQTALLIQDDIMDGSTKRRGQASFHEQISECLAKQGHREHKSEGKKIALAASSHLLQWLNQKIFNLSSALDIPELNEFFSRYLLQTQQGQLYDVSNIEFTQNVSSVKNLYSAKTGAYTFCLPFVLGYTIACSHRTLTQELTLEVLGENLGIVLQSRDDLSGFSLANGSLADLRDDLTNRQPALWTTTLRKYLSQTEFNFFKTIWNTQIITDADLYYLRFLYQKYSIANEIRKITEPEAKLGHQLIADLEIHPPFKRYWHSLIDYIVGIHLD